jgi:molybdopterin converting factor small subunit
VAVTVVVPGVLRSEAGGSAELTVPGGGTLADVLDELARQWPRLARRLRDERGDLRRYVNLFLDGEECRRLAGLATPVPPTAELLIIPSVAGG